MKKTETVVTTTTIHITEVRFGDVFQFTREVGCRAPGEMLVLQEGSSDAEATFLACLSKNGSQSNFTSLRYLNEGINSGDLIYLGNIDGKEE